MPENFIPDNKLEYEIAELSRQIADKRQALAKEQGMIEEEVGAKEALKQVLTEAVTDQSEDQEPVVANGQSFAATADWPAEINLSQIAYWDNLAEPVKNQVKSLIDLISSRGLHYSLRAARRAESPIVIDTYHDVLTEVLYQELKARDLV